MVIIFIIVYICYIFLVYIYHYVMYTISDFISIIKELLYWTAVYGIVYGCVGQEIDYCYYHIRRDYTWNGDL